MKYDTILYPWDKNERSMINSFTTDNIDAPIPTLLINSYRFIKPNVINTRAVIRYIMLIAALLNPRPY